MITTKMKFYPNEKLENEKAGLAIMGMSYANIALKSKKDGLYLVESVCNDAYNGNGETESVITKISSNEIYLRVKVKKGGKCFFSYSLDGKNFINAGDEFDATPGRWIGAKAGIFCTRESQTNDSGYADFDCFRVEPLQ